MGEVVCSVKYGDSQQRDLVLPDHIPVHQLVNSMAKALGLLLNRDLYYELKTLDGEELQRIPESRTLRSAFILNGSYLYLVQERVDETHSAFLMGKNELKLRLRENTIVGRLTPEVHVDIDLTPLDHDQVVSRRHAAITHVSYHYVIKDLNSRNGTYVNDTCLQENESIVLHPGDVICFGSLDKGVRLKFEA